VVGFISGKYLKTIVAEISSFYGFLLRKTVGFQAEKVKAPEKKFRSLFHVVSMLAF
jgi:hypothetical protein